MKTNFLYFRENGREVFTYASGNQEFTINGDDNWDLDVAADTEVKVTVRMYLQEQTTLFQITVNLFPQTL